MNILLINVPSRGGEGGFIIPFGLLYVASIVERSGHKVKIVDPYLYNIEPQDFDSSGIAKIAGIIDDFNPSIIGYGGISTSYGRTKRLSQSVKEKYPNILQIVGGPLSSVYELLLKNAAIDIVFHGETENNLPLFLDRLSRNEPIQHTEGISYLSEGNVIKNKLPKQIENLDDIPLPAYHLIDLEKYLLNVDDWFGRYENSEKSANYSSVFKRTKKIQYYFPIITSRGCTHKCLFCYRHFVGVRQHSVTYVINHMKYLQQTYGINGFYIADELFNADPDWVFDYCNAIEKNGLEIGYIVTGARINTTSEKMLQRLKETGCIEINYGQESGSDTILREYRKGVSRQQNTEITLLTNKVGIPSTVQIVIGSPSETNETINETISFLKSVGADQYSMNYLLPMPETPIWKYVEDNQLIDDVEKYLDRVADLGGGPIVNLTKIPDKIWRNWALVVERKMKLYYLKRNRLLIKYFRALARYFFMLEIVPLIPRRVKSIIKRVKTRLLV